MKPFKDKKILTFDCYGTLIDWEKGIITHLKPILMAHQTCPDDETILRIFGETEHVIQAASPSLLYRDVLKEVVVRIGKQLGFAPAPHEQLAFANSVGQWKPFPDTIEALGQLADKFGLVIISNIDNASIASSLQLLGIPFYRIFTAQEAGVYKPDAQIFHFVLEKLSAEGIRKDSILHVAESLYHDHIPAQSLGIDRVWINRRFNKVGSGATPPVDASIIPEHQFKTLIEFSNWISKNVT